MRSEELAQYIAARYGELNRDEIAKVTDITENPQINHIIYENGVWNMWDSNGWNFQFRKRNWR